MDGMTRMCKWETGKLEAEKLGGDRICTVFDADGKRERKSSVKRKRGC